jgi:uncharacterized protein (DUF934 family)
MPITINLVASNADQMRANPLKVLKLSNSEPVDSLSAELPGASVVELEFPKFNDGRAFSQAVQLRRRHGFKGDIRATGDVLIDQLLQMQRSGFTSAVLRDDQDAKHAEQLLAHFPAFYQGDARVAEPHFQREAQAA